jgi:hypothetical protein
MTNEQLELETWNSVQQIMNIANNMYEILLIS